MPLLVMIYPRGKGIDPASPQTIGQCVRVAEELGADMIKTSYPGSPEAFTRITKACSVPVFVAGGEKCSDLESLEMIRDSVAAGGAGASIGRNAFQHADARRIEHGPHDHHDRAPSSEEVEEARRGSWSHAGG